MKRYKKIIDGKTIIKSANDIVIRNNGKQTINPTEQMILADGWLEYEPRPYEPTLADIKGEKIENILSYDSSNAVNEFRIGGMLVWLDKATRAGLMLRFQAEQAAGMTITSLWYEGMQFSLPLADAIQMLYALELYASECYDRTQAHIAEVQKLESKEAVEAYDFTIGYPAKLTFDA